MTCFSPPHFVLGIGKLQQMAKKIRQTVGDAKACEDPNFKIFDQ
jgi:hypothetical protein